MNSDVGLPAISWDASEVPVIREKEIFLFTKVAGELVKRLESAMEQVDTNPTDEQKDSGRYRKGRFAWQGLTLMIENPKGSTRSGVGDDGKAWSTKMKNDYGYFAGTEDRDGDQVDFFIGPVLESELVFVINQVKNTRFDEHKVIVGAINEQQARDTYLSNYEDGWQGLGSVKAMTLETFKIWLSDEQATKKKAAPTKDYREQLRKMRVRTGRCPSCGEVFKADEPYPDVENCEVCERYGPPKEAGDHIPTVAVDLDGTLMQSPDKFDPSVFSPPKAGAAKWLKKFRDAGARIIIFTVRGNTEVIGDWLREHKIEYDFINENPDQPADSSGKVIADVYWDDRAISAAGELDDSGDQVLRMLKIASADIVLADPAIVLTVLRFIAS
jgi:hypothetical protein